MVSKVALAVRDLILVVGAVALALSIWAPAFLDSDHVVGTALVLWLLMTAHGEIVARGAK